MSAFHPRVFHVNDKRPGALYVGRRHGMRLGSEFENPFKGERALRDYLDMLEGKLPGFRHTGPKIADLARRELPGRDLECWCRGVRPACHAEILAGLADGEQLEAIRARLLERVEGPVSPGPLFGGGS